MIKNITNRIVKWGPVVSLVNVSKKIVLPGFEGASLYYVARFFWDSLVKGGLTTRASAISFKLIMASIPAMIVLISAIPLIFPQFTDQLQQAMSAFLPKETMDILTPYLDQLFAKGGAIVSVGFILAIYYSSSAFQSILAAFARSINITEQRSLLSQQLVSLAILGLITIFIVAALAAMTVSENLLALLQKNEILVSDLGSSIFYILNYLVIFLLFMFAISTLYNMGNPQRKKWQFTSAGATVASILMILVSAGFAYYVNNFGNYNKLYGSIGAILVFFFWIYYNSIILLIGFELNLSISAANEKIQKLKG
ncbi:MAG: YihY/virulence factor BrkB family protein [Flavobacteriales bacterium]|nr:YihY/virulence factor BrkB family protein [Flavobacteriales bacterium]